MKRPLSAPRRKRIESQFADAARLHQAGDFASAERLYREIIEIDPRHADACHYLGLIRHRQGALEEAAALLERAAPSSSDASLLNNLGNMLRELGRHDDAIESYRRAVKLDDGNVNAHFNLASLSLDTGDAAAARKHYETVLSHSPRDVAVLNGLGLALLKLDDPASAVDRFREACDRAPDDAGSLANLAQALLVDERLHEAHEAAMRAVDIAPEHRKARKSLGIVSLNLERYAVAEEAFRTLIERDPGDREAYGGLTQALVALRREEEAVAVCDRAIDRFPGDAEIHCDKGLALKQLGRLDEAVEAFEAAIDIDANLARAYNNLGVTYVDLGDRAGALECIRRALELEPDLPEALQNLLRTRSNRLEDLAEIESIETLAGRRSLNLGARISLHFGLGKALDDCGLYDRAFDHYESANRLKRKTVRFAPDKFETWVQGFHDTFTADFFRRNAGIGLDSDRPVFIVGMPRSGTTLVEQILASHRDVYGADELRIMSDLVEDLPARLGVGEPYPRAAARLDERSARDLANEYLAHLAAIDDRALRVTDKMPSNYFHLGVIAVALPGAHVIHCTRDPMDVCFSNYIQHFGDGHFYSYDLADIAVYFREYQRIMHHWREVLPITIHEVAYEALVEEQERVTRGMLDYLGLSWDEACLNFHQTRRAVRTASHWQVRQPIYRSSQRRWRHYAHRLEPLREAIGYEAPP